MIFGIKIYNISYFFSLYIKNTLEFVFIITDSILSYIFAIIITLLIA